jgi:hypothetical protein
MDFFRFMLVSKESWVTKNDIWEVRLEDDEIKEPIIKDEDKISDVINGFQNLYNTLRK